ncbi:MAG: PD-(D/E)XK nuclease domain-containing protein, partial [Lachnospiraceae bacterium]|nr:PD-(D/E)XK nuclease domain-containing protein [Lachnospiraceae bacterium]
FAEFVGFTTEEVEMLCEQYGIDFAECRRWYDGYTQRGIEIYNPESVVQSMERGEYGSYWGQTSTYEVISDRIRANHSGLKDAVIRMIAGESVDVIVTQYLNTMDSFRTMDEELTYLIHVGYLTYDRREETCRIPNREVRQEWHRAIRTEPGYETTDRIIRDSKELLKETVSGNADAVAKALDETHIHVTSNRSYNNEDALQSAIYLAYIYALNQYNVYKELTSGKGFADVVYVPVEPELPAMVIELKRNDSAESAIDQIRERKYYASLEHYSGNLLFVGINYDEKSKTHTCNIERFVKQ